MMLLSIMTMSVIDAIARYARQMAPLPGSAPTTTAAPLPWLEVTKRAGTWKVWASMPMCNLH